MMPERVVQIRREICARKNCSSNADFANPCAWCPEGHWGAYEPCEATGLGDKIAANPIVHAIGVATGCVDKQTQQLKPESGCGKMKARLNAGMSLYEAVILRSQGK